MEKQIVISLIIMYLGTIYISLKHKNYEKKNIDFTYYKKTTLVYFLAMFYLFIFIYFFKDKVFNQSSDINILQELLKIIIYFLIIDFLFYWYHRIVHRNKTLKKYIHEYHHDYYSIPSDSLNISIYELFITSTLLFVPSLFLNIKLETLFIIIGLYYLHQLYIHSETSVDIPFLTSAKFHEDHHKIGRGNYSVVFSYLDTLFNTNIPKNSNSSTVIDSSTTITTNFSDTSTN